MNFFEQQDLAQRNTKRLVLLFFAAVVSLILLATFLLSAVLGYLQQGSTVYLYESQGGFWQNILHTFSWEMLGVVCVIVAMVVLLGSAYKTIQLRSGGKAVAEAMGGKLISLHAADADEKKVLNVVEEMAIASGTPVPPVYIIEDDAINAFAAGHNPQDAVIGITRGCIRLLTRDELQGVIAHEFSHIFHGDMRLNIRLVALLHGILLLGLIGYYLVRSAGYRSMSRSSRNNSPAALMGIGVALIVIGYSGTFFGNLIKAAVSRQREFLADASAVQFTRNPEGIAGALKKIGGYASGSKIESAHAAEFSHMYFSQGVSTAFNALMATHPPLNERIKRVQPNWDGKFPQVEVTLADAVRSATQKAAEPTASQLHPETQANFSASASAIDSSVNNIGQPTAAHLAYAHAALNKLSNELREAARDPFSARALIYGLLRDKKKTTQEKQWQSVRKHLNANEAASVQKLMNQTMELDEDLRLPLLELTLPALKQLSPEQHENFKSILDALIHADNKVNLMEWSLRRIVIHHIEGHPTPKLKHPQQLRELRDECQLLLSFLAYAGGQTEAAVKAAFESATSYLRLSTLTLLPKSMIKISLLDNALDRLHLMKPLQKPLLLKAMSQCIMHDEKVSIAEAELFRAVADGLDCPIPPFVPH